MSSFFDLNNKRKDKKDDEEGYGASYLKLDKTVVFQENDKVNKMEATDAFFAITKLFQSTDGAMVQSIERYLKQAIVDKSPAIASSVLTSVYSLMGTCPDIIKRWTNEIQEAAMSSKPMVQYHALGLLYSIRRLDRLAVTKMIQKFTGSTVKSPYAYCLMVRIVAKQLQEEGLSKNPVLFEFLESSLRNKSEMVIYEAARAIISLRNLTAKELAPAVSVLQILCSASKIPLRYAAVHTLNVVANNYPAAVIVCNLNLEQMISDFNRSVSTLAITTLLKTGNESNVERLLKQVNPHMSEISDEFKIVVLNAIRDLAVKYPKKYTVLLSFLSGFLRDSSGYTFKKAVVSVIESIIKQIPEAKSIGLLQLCEFIEDCEHVKLTQRIIHLLGREGPYLKKPRHFIRYIYNRVMLEASPIKCTATTALARFAVQNDDLLPSVLVLLKRIMIDEDDEVRDRAAFYHHILSTNSHQLKSVYLLNEESHLSLAGLERALMDYTHNPNAISKGPFLLATVPVIAPIQTPADASHVDPMGSNNDQLKASSKQLTSDRSGQKATHDRTQDDYMEQLAAIPQFSSLGPLFKSSNPVELTEPDTEYVVTCVKHMFLNHLVLQFNCTNTMSDQILNDIYVDCEPEDAEFVIQTAIHCPVLKFNCPGITYVLVQLPDDFELHSTTFVNTLKFKVKDADKDSLDPGLSDEYQLEDLDVSISDHIQRIPKTNFSVAWQDLSEDTQVEEMYMLTKYKTIKETMRQIIQHLGLQPCDRSDHLPNENCRTHQLSMSGIYRGGCQVLAYCKLAKLITDPTSVDEGITFQITVRSSNPLISRVVADAVG